MQNAIIVTRQNDLKEGENISSKTLELRSKYKPKYNITNYFEFGIDDNTNDSDHNIIFSHIHQNNVDNIIVSDFSQISGKISNIMSFVEYCNKQKINIIIDNYKLDTLNKDKSVNSIVQKILNVGADLAFLEKEFFQKKLNNGRAKYIRKGGLLGRKSGSRETKATFLSKHNDIISLLKQYSYKLDS